jgi:hypothetical protein
MLDAIKDYKYILVLNHKASHKKLNTRDHNTASSQEIDNTVPKISKKPCER